MDLFEIARDGGSASRGGRGAGLYALAHALARNNAVESQRDGRRITVRVPDEVDLKVGGRSRRRERAGDRAHLVTPTQVGYTGMNEQLRVRPAGAPSRTLRSDRSGERLGLEGLVLALVDVAGVEQRLRVDDLVGWVDHGPRHLLDVLVLLGLCLPVAI